MSGTDGQVVAAVDVGTASTRLLVSDASGRTLVRSTVVCGLGAGVASSGRLAADGVAATLDALRSFRAQCDEHGVARIRAVGTAVLRGAVPDDVASFLAAAASALGAPVEVVDGPTEAALSHRGALAALPPVAGTTATVDLGGGSIDVAVGGAGAPPATWSLPVGAVGLTERFLQGDPPPPEDLVAALSIVEAHLDDLVRGLPEVASADRVVGLGGTFTTMAAVELGLEPFDDDAVHGFVLTRAAAEDVFRTLVTEPLLDRVHNPGLPADRAVHILGGATAVVATYRFLGLDAVVVTGCDLLDGIVADLR